MKNIKISVLKLNTVEVDTFVSGTVYLFLQFLYFYLNLEGEKACLFKGNL